MPGSPPPPGRSLRPAPPAVRQRATIALLLGALSVLALLGLGSNFHRGLFLVIFSLAVGIGGCWLGITALRQARGAGAWRPRGAIFGIVFGALGGLLSIVLLIAFTVFWSQLSQYSRCLAGANTLSAQQACLTQLNKSVNGEIARIAPAADYGRDAGPRYGRDAGPRYGRDAGPRYGRDAGPRYGRDAGPRWPEGQRPPSASALRPRIQVDDVTAVFWIAVRAWLGRMVAGREAGGATGREAGGVSCAGTGRGYGGGWLVGWRAAPPGRRRPRRSARSGGSAASWPGQRSPRRPRLSPGQRRCRPARLTGRPPASRPSPSGPPANPAAAASTAPVSTPQPNPQNAEVSSEREGADRATSNPAKPPAT